MMLEESGDELIRRIVEQRLHAHQLGSEELRSTIAREVSGDIRDANPKRVLIAQGSIDELEAQITRLKGRVVELENKLEAGDSDCSDQD